MAAGDTRAADPVDTVHHEMDSLVCSHRFYKSVQLPVLEQLILEKEPARPIHTMNLQYVAVINDSQIASHTPLKFYSQIT